MMPTLNPKDAQLLPKLLGMLGSDHDGEILAAVRRARAVLDRNKMNWGDLARQTGGSSGGGSYATGYADGVAAAKRAAGSVGRTEFDRGYEKGKADAWEAARKAQAANDARRQEGPQREAPKPKAETSTRHWPPDDDIWFGHDPEDPDEGLAEYHEQISQLNELWAIETRLSDFEHNFVQSIAEQLLEKGRLSDRQCEVLDDIHTRRCMRVRR